MTDWSRRAGMTCCCAAKCTTGDTWGDGPTPCSPLCEPCRINSGTPYSKPWTAKSKKLEK